MNTMNTMDTETLYDLANDGQYQRATALALIGILEELQAKKEPQDSTPKIESITMRALAALAVKHQVSVSSVIETLARSQYLVEFGRTIDDAEFGF